MQKLSPVFRFATASLAMAALLAGCTKVGSSSGDNGGRHPYTHAHEMSFAAAEDITGLNPMFATQQTVSYMANMTMAYLIKTDKHGEATVPELITEVPTQANKGISADGLTITWHIRKNVVWSDGKPFDADDVVFSTNLTLDPKTNMISRDGWDQIVKVDEPDKFTVVYRLKKPYGAYAYTYFSTGGANPCLLPKHLLAGKNVNTDPYNSLPVGIGPFKYQEWKRGDSVVMVPNPTYFRGTPKLQKITYKLIQDRNTVLEQLRTHELDLWIPTPGHYVHDVRAIPGIKVDLVPVYFWDHVDFNLQHPIANDLVVRTAMRMAIDRKTLNEKIGNGVSTLSESVVPVPSRFYDKIPLVPFDLAGANALLDKDGWTKGPDGIRVKGGRRLSLVLASSVGSPDIDSRIELMRSWWKQIGLELEVKRYLSSLFFAPSNQGGIIYGGKFDLVNFAWGGDPNQDISNLFACYRFPPNGQNDPRYCNQKVTDAIDRAKVQYDPDKRVADMKFIQEQIFHDVPDIVLDSRNEIHAYNDDLKNWKPNPISPFDDMMDVDI